MLQERIIKSFVLLVMLAVVTTTTGCSQQVSGSVESQVTRPATPEQDLYLEEDVQEYQLDSDIAYEEYEEGVNDACSRLFYYSYDSNVYAQGIALSSMDCQYWGGSYDGDYDSPYEEGYWETVEEMFSTTPFWCWGEDCVTESDF